MINFFFFIKKKESYDECYTKDVNYNGTEKTFFDETKFDARAEVERGKSFRLKKPCRVNDVHVMVSNIQFFCKTSRFFLNYTNER